MSGGWRVGLPEDEGKCCSVTGRQQLSKGEDWGTGGQAANVTERQGKDVRCTQCVSSDVLTLVQSLNSWRMPCLQTHCSSSFLFRFLRVTRCLVTLSCCSWEGCKCTSMYECGRCTDKGSNMKRGVREEESNF